MHNDSVFTKIRRWVVEDFFGILKEMRISYLPPLMVYLAAGISGFTGIIESFYVKQELGLSPAFLASLGFWAGLPWALKMPIGHLVDLFWKRKAFFVYFGAFLMSIGLLIMVGLTGFTDVMTQYLSAEIWFVLSTLISPIGFVLQDVVADAMTVEAVPEYDADGNPIPEETLKRNHITMQTLGRIAIIGGSALVAGVGGWLAMKMSYKIMYMVALIIPLISILGVSLGQIHNRRRRVRLQEKGLSQKEIEKRIYQGTPKLSPNWYILGGSGLFILITLTLGLSDINLKKEVIFLGSLAIIIFLMRQILAGISAEKRREIIGLATIIFVFRAMPSVGAGASWWQIDTLGFDEAFFGTLRQISSLLVIFGLFALRGWMTRRPLPYLIVFLSIYSGFMMLPYIGMYHGLHEWTQANFGFGARTIAIIDTMADSPLGQVAMVPMLAWIAREAPLHQKATFFAVMAAFTNLALSGANLATSYMNKIYIIERGNYEELGNLFVSVALLGVVIPVVTVWLVNGWKNRAAISEVASSH